MGFLEELETFCPLNAQYIVTINTMSQLVSYFLQKYVPSPTYFSDKAKVFLFSFLSSFKQFFGPSKTWSVTTSNKNDTLINILKHVKPSQQVIVYASLFNLREISLLLEKENILAFSVFVIKSSFLMLISQGTAICRPSDISSYCLKYGLSFS